MPGEARHPETGAASGAYVRRLVVGGVGALRCSRSFFLRRRSAAQRRFGLEPRPMPRSL
jgi:hypothetical protein